VPPLDRDVTLAILIGGRARRLGGQAKHALKVGRQTILDRQLAAAADAGIRDVLLVGGEHRLDGGLRHYADVVEGGGALGGLYSALVLATTPVVLVIAGDLPFISPALLQRLAAVDQDEDAVVPRTERGWHPLCAGYRRHVSVVVKARLDRSQLRVTDLLS